MTERQIRRIRNTVRVLRSLTDEELEAVLEELEGKEIPEYQPQEKATDYRERVKKAVMEYGIPNHLKGFKYAQEAILWVIENPGEFSITNDLYPYVAEKFGTTWGRVERALGRAVVNAWNQGERECHKKAFAREMISRTPTNRTFVLAMAEYVKKY